MISLVKRMETSVSLPSISSVKEFVNIVSDFKCTVSLASDRYTVDAKSIMGVFSLDLSKPLKCTLEAATDDKNDCENCLAAVKNFVTA